MAGKSTLAHAGSAMVGQWRKAFSRHARSHSGSSFLREIRRTMSSLRPLGAVSDSMSVMKPYLYFSAAIDRTCSAVSTFAAIQPILRQSKHLEKVYNILLFMY